MTKNLVMNRKIIITLGIIAMAMIGFYGCKKDKDNGIIW